LTAGRADQSVTRINPEPTKFLLRGTDSNQMLHFRKTRTEPIFRIKGSYPSLVPRTRTLKLFREISQDQDSGLENHKSASV